MPCAASSLPTQMRGRAPRRAPRGRRPPRGSPGRSPARPRSVSSSAPGLLEGRRSGSSPRLLDARAEAALGELDVDAVVPARAPRARAHDAVVRPDDRVTRAERCLRGQRAAGGRPTPRGAARLRSTSRSRRARAAARRLRARSRLPARRSRSRAGCRARARSARRSRPLAELALVGNDQPCRRRRRRGARVGGEVAERRVLLVPDGRDDRDGAGRDRADDPLVAEREEVLEAAAAAGEHDDVDLRLRGQRVAARRRSRRRRAAPARASRRRGSARPETGPSTAVTKSRFAAASLPVSEADPAREAREAAACAGARRAPRRRASACSRSMPARSAPSPSGSIESARSWKTPRAS